VGYATNSSPSATEPRRPARTSLPLRRRLLAMATLLWLASCLIASCVRTKTITRTVTVPVALAPVLTDPPPLGPSQLSARLDVGDPACPKQLVCMDAVTAIDLALQIGNAHRLVAEKDDWMRAAWQRVGVQHVESLAGSAGDALRAGWSSVGAVPAAVPMGAGSNPPGSFGEP
jgi:hypothetical protein